MAETFIQAIVRKFQDDPDIGNWVPTGGNAGSPWETQAPEGTPLPYVELDYQGGEPSYTFEDAFTSEETFALVIHAGIGLANAELIAGKVMNIYNPIIRNPGLLVVDGVPADGFLGVNYQAKDNPYRGPGGDMVWTVTVTYTAIVEGNLAEKF